MQIGKSLNRTNIVISTVLLLILYACSKTDRVAASEILPVLVNGKWGGIDISGEIVLPIEYDWVYYNYLKTGYVIVEQNPFKKVVNCHGEVVVDSIVYSSRVHLYNEYVLIETIEGSDTMKKAITLEELNCGDITVSQKANHLPQISYPSDGLVRVEFEKSTKSVKRISDFTTSGFAAFLDYSSFGYLSTKGDVIWSNNIESLLNYWELIETNDINSIPDYDERYDRSLESNEVVRFYFPYLSLNLREKVNTDFNFLPYQSGLSN